MKHIPDRKHKNFERRSNSVIVQPDDLEVGQLIAIHAFKYSDEPGPFHGMAVRVKAINLPFVVALPMMDVNDSPVTLDVRFLNLMKVTEEYAKAQAISQPHLPAEQSQQDAN